MINKKFNKGFTLIELLVVIAIIAILAVVVILTLNPAQLLAQARDSNRTSDMATLKSGISLYLADVSSTNLLGSFAAGTCFVSENASTAVQIESPTSSPSTNFISVTNCQAFIKSATVAAINASGSRNIDSTGWIPINFNAISAGSPFGNEPVDPLVTSNKYFYAYYATSSNNTFKLVSTMESTKYAAGGGGDVETNDGGIDVNMFESGTNPAL